VTRATADAKRERKRRLNREAVARHAARQEAGIAVARQVEYRSVVVVMLVYLGWLVDREAHTDAEISKAISDLLADTAKNF
jgi:hypothetical protein